MEKIIINCGSGQVERQPLTEMELSDMQKRKMKQENDDVEEKSKFDKRAAALDRVKKNKDLADLLIALGIE